MSIADLLVSIGLGDYVPEFEAQGIDEDMLSGLTSDDLRELGVGALGHRKRILAAIRERYGQRDEVAEDPGARDPQKRQVSVLFADLVGSTALSQRLEAEELCNLIRAYHTVAKDAIEHYGGHIAQYLGDGVLAYFGFPVSHEDDPERAVRGAFKIISALEEIESSTGTMLGVEVKARIGIETGPVVVGDILTEASGKGISIVGETPNIAKRFQSSGGPGDIVIGPRTRDLLPETVVLEPLGPLDLKGVEDPVNAWRVVEPGTNGGSFERKAGSARGPFVGRAMELEELDTAMAEVRSGGDVCISIVGDAGIGKSRLVHEFLTRAPPTTHVFSGHCMRFDARVLHPFAQILSNLAKARAVSLGISPAQALRREILAMSDDLAPDVPYLLRLSGHTLEPETVDSELLGTRIQAAIVRMFRAAGRVLPTILFVNDIHWIDELSEDVLDTMVRSAELQGVLIICTYRPPYTPPWIKAPNARTLTLRPLDSAAVARLYRSMTSLVEPDIGDIVERSGGNPLFVEALAALAKGPGTHPDGSEGGFPPSLSGLLLQHVDRLSPKSQSLLRTASVIGRHFDIDLTMPASLSRDLAVTELQSTGLLIADGSNPARFRFKHALIRDAVYDSLLGADKRRLHAAVAHRLESRSADSLAEVAEELARHFEIAEEQIPAARYAFVAGEKALELFALRDAGRWLERCLALFPTELDVETEHIRMQAVSNLIQVTCWDARFDEMVALSDQELHRVRALGATSMVSRILSWLGEAYLHGGRFADSRAVLDEALAIAETLNDEPAIAHALAERSWLQSITGTPLQRPEDEAVIERTRALGDIHRNRLVSTFAMYATWANACHDGRLLDARTAAAELIEFGNETGYPPAKCWGACLASQIEAMSGNADKALSYCDLAAREAACGYDKLLVDLCCGVVLETIGRYDAAIDTFEAAGRGDFSVGMFYFGYASSASRGRALMAGKRASEGERSLRSAAEHFRRIGHLRATTMTLVALGDGLIRFPDRMADAESIFEEAQQLAHRSGMMGMQGLAVAARGCICTRSGRFDASNELFAQAKAIVAPLGWPALAQRVNAAAEGLGPFLEDP